MDLGICKSMPPEFYDIFLIGGQFARDRCIVMAVCNAIAGIQVIQIKQFYKFPACSGKRRIPCISHYIRDYYVQIDGWDGNELEVIEIYAPVLENGERMPDIAKKLESKYN